MPRQTFHAIYRNLECRLDSYQQGNTLQDAGRYQEAFVSYERALEYNPYDYWAWYWRADILDIWGCFEEALASYNKALLYKPYDYWAWCS